MAFGSGVLISALTFELTAEAFDRGGTDAVAIGLAAGAISFFIGDSIIDKRGGDKRKSSSGQPKDSSASAILLGALMDGIPESVAIGVSLIGGGSVGASVVVAVFLSNVPESLSSATGMQKDGKSLGHIFGVWGAVVLVSTLAAALGYQFLGGASSEVIALIDAFAAGAILTMLADTMMPEAFEHAGSTIGLVTVLGFSLAFYLSTLE
jgi:ZIP family zinc transporter